MLKQVDIGPEIYKLRYIDPLHGKEMPGFTNGGEDIWGYYNGEDGFHSPHFKIYDNLENATSHGNSSFLNSDYRYAQIGALRSIEYPTGGRVEYEYEGNDFSGVSFLPGNSSLETDPGVQMQLDSSYSKNILVASYINQTGSFLDQEEEFIVHKDQNVEIAITLGLFQDVSFELYSDTLFQDFSYGTATVGVEKYNDATGVFESIYSYSVNPFDSIGDAPDETIYGVLKARGWKNALVNLALTEGRYKLSCGVNGYNLQASIGESSVFPYKNSTKNYNAGGIRIRRIRAYSDSSTLAYERWFAYTRGDSSSGVLESPFSNAVFTMYWESVEEIPPGGDFKQEFCYFVNLYNSSIIPLGNSHGGVVGYAQVTDSLINGGKTVLRFTNGSDSSHLFADQFLLFDFGGATLARSHITTDNSWKRGLERERSIYDSSGNILQRHFTDYYFHVSPSDTSISLVFSVLFDVPGNFQGLLQPNYIQTRSYKAYHIADSATYYTGTGVLSDVTSYEYDLNYSYPWRVSKKASDGSNKRTIYKYAKDFPVGSTPSNNAAAGLKKLQASHILSPVIEQVSQYKGANESTWRTNTSNYIVYKSLYPAPDTTFTLRSDIGIENYQPVTIDSVNRVTDGRLWPETVVLAYDSAVNPVSLKGVAGIQNTYIWGYDRYLLIAEVVNADSSQCAYTSLEEGALGGWALSPGSTILLNTNAITGGSSLDGELTKNVPTGNYILTFWSIGAVSVNGTAYTDPPKRDYGGGKRYFEVTLNNVSSVQISGDNIDEIRLYPVGAQMTTYTHDPLIGMTSRSDPEGRPTYFEYDVFGRLHLIRDDHLNILRRICYNYAGQPEDCDPVNLYVQWTYENVISTDESGVRYFSGDVYLRLYDKDGNPTTLDEDLVVSTTWTQQMRDTLGNVSMEATYPLDDSLIPAGTNAVMIAQGSFRYYPIDGSGNMLGDTLYDTFVTVLPSVHYIVKPWIFLLNL